MKYDINAVRANFPSLQAGAIFLDNPGGTQVAQSVIDAMREYFLTANANTGGAFATSSRTDEMIADARRAFADFFNAPSPNEIVFGANMTSLTFNVARALGRNLTRNDEIIVTHLDHDANIAPWLALEERGAVVKWVDIHRDDCTLDMADFEKQLSNKTKIVAVGLASNAVGTVNDVRTIVDLAHMAGALVYVDAVHFAPHFPIDVQAVNCDFLVCSAYKFYGPHLGILFGKHALLERFTAYKVRPAHDEPPEKWEVGTQNHEGIAGARAALDYLASLGEKFGGEYAKEFREMSERRLQFKAGMSVMRVYEKNLFIQLMNGLREIDGIEIYGIQEAARFDYHAPTVAFNLRGIHPRAVAEKLASANINVWSGNYYALALMERLGLEDKGGAVRVGLAHYNTKEEVDSLIGQLQKIPNR